MSLWLPSELLNHLWQSTLCAAVVWIAALALHNNGARVRYWLWTAASIKFLVPLSVLVRLGEQFHWREAPAAVQPAVRFMVQEILSSAAIVMVAPASSPGSSIPQPAPVLPWVLLVVWALGAILVLLSWWRQWLPIRSSLRQATPVRLNSQYGADDLTVMSSPSMPEPGVIGVRRPRLLLPEGILERLTPPQLGALIAHERCHIRCHDNLVAAIHMVVEAMFWFHPAVWWIETRLLDERERACDEAVLRAGSRPQDYAEGILEVCRQSVGMRLTCVAGVSGSNLRARVEAIMRNEIGRPLTRGRRWALVVTTVAIVIGPIAGGAMTRAAQSQLVVPPAGLEFEVASVTSSRPLPGEGTVQFPFLVNLQKAMLSRPRKDPGVRVGGPLHVLIQLSYNLARSQVEGGPSWALSDSYAIAAETAIDATSDQVRGMLQALLAERFKLTLRRETRILPVYELVVADGGLKIAAMKEGECVAGKDLRWDLIDLDAPPFVCDGGGWRRTLSQNPETRPFPRWPRVDRLHFGGVLMSQLVDFIAGDVDRIVIDKTGFAERFNLLLDFAPPSRPESRLPAPSGPTIFAALEEQLGLSLVSVDAPVDVFVIDSAERPSEN
jgi:uncharacterized protein (TIGR03435 family)